MSEETTETQASQEQPVVQSLDDIISEFNITPSQPAAAEPKPVERAAPQQSHNDFVDPLNETQWQQYQQRVADQSSALQGELQSMRAELDGYKQERHQAQVNADIKNAVEKVSELSGIDQKRYLEFRLEQKAAEDPKFQMIWDNRQKNPAALEAALKTVSHEISGELDFMADPNITESHRAVKQSQQSSQSTKTSEYNNPIEEELAGAKTEAERQQIWDKYRHG